ncbi:MAG: hypothetical protein IH595_01010 [Bacteroidales bacterium]|nr:hypothetical protein [Bacteroidales bacterium]
MKINLYKNHLDESKVQFYNSKKIVLKRNLTYKETKLARGKIKYQNGQYFEEIIIPKDTPGVLDKNGSHMMSVAFEKGKNRALNFVLNKNDHYQLSALVWADGYGRVSYDTLVYYVEPKSASAQLMVKKDNSFIFNRNIRKVKGRLVDQ